VTTQESQVITATFLGKTYSYRINVKESKFGYYDLLTADKGYQLVTSTENLAQLCEDYYFVLASEDANLLISLKDAPKNGNKALTLQTPTNPKDNLSELFQIENYGAGFTLRNMDYDGLTLQTEWDHPEQLRTHDQPFACEWSLLLLKYENDCWSVENGKYTGNWLATNQSTTSHICKYSPSRRVGSMPTILPMQAKRTQ